jgi:flagellar motor switch protein FliN/FliY
MDQPARTKSDNRINNKDTEEADKSRLTDLETDALGESVNISMGSAAKTLSSLLNLKVIITTPKVDILKSEEFEYKSMLPAMSVTIRYIEGLTGLNFFVLKQSDITKIVNIMLGQPDKNDDNELTELHISAISEVMNQMMGASSTSLATFYRRKINISTPICIAINENNNVNDVLGLHGDIVVIKLKLIITVWGTGYKFESGVKK